MTMRLAEVVGVVLGRLCDDVCLAKVVGVMLDWPCDDNCLSMNDVEHDKTLVIMSFMM